MIFRRRLFRGGQHRIQGCHLFFSVNLIPQFIIRRRNRSRSGRTHDNLSCDLRQPDIFEVPEKLFHLSGTRSVQRGIGLGKKFRGIRFTVPHFFGKHIPVEKLECGII